jgi:hypothetical protein
MRTPAEALLPKEQWEESQPGWMPLRQAVFQFGMTDDDEAVHDKPLPNLSEFQASSSELLRQWAVAFEASATAPSSRLQLEEMLLKKSGADRVEIDLTASTFSFEFGKSVYGGTPWAILEEQKTTAEPLDDEEGFIRIGAKEAARLNQRYQAIRRATGLAWHQFMLRTFDRAVLAGTVVLYARSPTITDDFVGLPATAWAVLTVIDWANGTAIAPDGTVYWSLMGGQPATMADSDDAAAKAVGAMIGPQPHDIARIRILGLTMTPSLAGLVLMFATTLARARSP